MSSLVTDGGSRIAQQAASSCQLNFHVFIFERRLIKAGVLAKRFSPRVSRLSAAAELVGYAGSLAFGAFQLLALQHEEAALRRRLLRLPQVLEFNKKSLSDSRSALPL